MAHEILAVKLCELDEQLSRLSGRIYLSETAAHAQLRREIQSLRRECEETELTLRTKLRHSRTGMAPVMADAYERVERCVQSAQAALEDQALRSGGPEALAEEKILLAEYALDFALQGANRALLLAMEAIDAQYTGQEGDKSSS